MKNPIEKITKKHIRKEVLLSKKRKMKKIWLLTLFVFGILCTGCNVNVTWNDSSQEENNAKPNLDSEAGRLLACNEKVGFYLNTNTFKATWDPEEEAGASFVLNGHLIREEQNNIAEDDAQCIIDMVDHSVNIEFLNHKFNGELQNESWAHEEVLCGEIYDPLCGSDGKLYTNGCYLNKAGIIRDKNLGVKNHECIPLTKENLYGNYSLIRYNDNHTIKDSFEITLTLAETGIFAKFCNHMGASEYSLSWDILQVKAMNQNLMACEGEKGERLMNAEKRFILDQATIILSEENLTINTPKGDQYQFKKE